MTKISTCNICKTSFKPGPGCKGLYCSKSCSYKGLAIKNKIRNKKYKEENPSQNLRYCKHCGSLITSRHAKIFCSNSCTATWNNYRRTYKKRPPGNCLACGKELVSFDRKYCSNACHGLAMKIQDPEYHKKRNAYHQSKYRAKQLRQMHPDANHEKIKEIYRNCPPGYEVDHVVPLSLGGAHHEDNLQYLTIEENRRKGNRWIG